MPKTDNMEMFREGDILTISIDLSKRYGDSSTGKTTTVASSGGFMDVPDSPGMILSLNLAEKKPK
jgi:hypothetical protein